MKNLITENSIYTNDQEKEAFVANKQNVATAFWVNLLGMFGLFSFSHKKGLMKTYFQDDGMLRLTTITDQNKDLSLLVKLYQEAGGLPIDSANKLTKLLSLIKQKAITSKNFDEAAFKEIVSDFKWQSVRPLPVVLNLVKSFLEDNAPIQTIGKEMYYLVKTRKKEVLPFAGEFYAIAKQYIPQMGNVPRLADLKNDGTTPQSAAVAATIVTAPSAQVSDTPVANVAQVDSTADVPLPSAIVNPTATPAFARGLTGYGNYGTSNVIPSFNLFDPLSSFLKKPDSPVQEPEVVQYVEPVSNDDGDSSVDNTAIVKDVSAENAKNEKYARALDEILLLKEYKDVSKYLKAEKIDIIDFKQWFDGMIVDAGATGRFYRSSIFASQESFNAWYVVLLPFITRGTDSKKSEYIANIGMDFPEIVATDESIKVFSNWFATLKTSEITDNVASEAMRVFSIAHDNSIKTRTTWGSGGKYFDQTLRVHEARKIHNTLQDTRKYKYWLREGIASSLKNAFENRDTKSFENLFILANENNRGNNDLVALFELPRIAYDSVWEEFNFSEEFLDVLGSKVAMNLKFRKSRESTLHNDYQYGIYFHSFLPLDDFGNTEKDFIELFESSASKAWFSRLIPTSGTAGFVRAYSEYDYSREVDIEYAKAIFKYCDSRGIEVNTAINLAKAYFDNVTDFNDEVWKLALARGTDLMHFIPEKLNTGMLETMASNGVDLESALLNLSVDKLLKFNSDHPVLVDVQRRRGIINEYTIAATDFTKPVHVDFITGLLQNRRFASMLTDEQKRLMVSGEGMLSFIQATARLQNGQRGLKGAFEEFDGFFETTPENVDRLQMSLSLFKYSKPVINKTASAIIKDESIGADVRKTIFTEYVDSWAVLDDGASLAVAKLVRENPSDSRIMSKFLETMNPEKFDDFYDTILSKLTDSDSVNALREVKRSVYNRTLVRPYIEKLQNSEVPIGFKLDAGRAIEILKYNNIELKPFDPAVKISDALAEDIKLNELPIQEDEEMTQRDCDALSVALLKYRNGRHGDTAIRVLKSFNVNMQSQIDGVEAKKAELKAAGIKILSMEPVFHGTGPVAANMILRNGFRVMGGGAISIAGRLLGDGIYFSNVIDKAAQYVKTDVGDGYGRSHGTVGCMFEMYALLGRNRIDYLSGTNKRLVSPEWCVYDANRQLIIKRAWQVERTSTAKIDALRSNLTEEEIDAMKPLAEKMLQVRSFDDMLSETLVESEVQMNKHAVTVRFVRGVVTDEMISKFGNNVALDSDQSFIIYNDRASFTFEIPHLGDFRSDVLDELLSGDVDGLIDYEASE